MNYQKRLKEIAEQAYSEQVNSIYSAGYLCCVMFDDARCNA